jgi:prepilin-type N-terminal cleavage/methylation domain-containing protein/prepilin-type processing-associated H-X9-DG protein
MKKSARRYGSKIIQCQGFTLVELLVVMAIVGLFASLALPAIQSTRETARRMTCQSNLRNHALAINEFELVKRFLPPGRDRRKDVDWAWSFQILPMLEQAELFLGADQSLRWDATKNQIVVDRALAIFRCPSAVKNFAGDCDFAGLMGTVLNAPTGLSPFNRGVLVYVDGTDHVAIPLSSVSDGLSQTLCVSENHDLDSPVGRWASGLNCISHDYGRINSSNEGIRSSHKDGANAVYLDGAVTFLSDSCDENILACLLTRSGGETFQGWY